MWYLACFAAERGCAFEFFSVYQDYLELAAKIFPGGVARNALRHEHGHDAFVAELFKAVPVAKDLAQAEPELLLFVVVGDALDLGDEHSPVCFPCQVEIWFLGQPRAWFDSGAAKGPRELILSTCMAPQAPLYERRVDCEWLAGDR